MTKKQILNTRIACLSKGPVIKAMTLADNILPIFMCFLGKEKIEFKVTSISLLLQNQV